ncbi:MAG: hypothetical protein QM784_37610, partial [Polyangiaceae bacterium]
IVEGVMGLFDGVDPTSNHGSTAEMAQLLDANVVLVDAHAMARGSFAATVQGLTVNSARSLGICRHREPRRMRPTVNCWVRHSRRQIFLASSRPFPRVRFRVNPDISASSSRTSDPSMHLQTPRNVTSICSAHLAQRANPDGALATERRSDHEDPAPSRGGA